MDDRRSARARAWLCGACVALLTLCYCAFPIMDPDLGHHLVLGEYILSHGAIPGTNVFSYANPNFPVLDYKWLFEVFLYLLHSRLGVAGLYLLQIGAPLLTLAVMAWGMEFQRAPERNAWLLAAAAPILATRAAPRPEVLSLLLLAVYAALLLRASPAAGPSAAGTARGENGLRAAPAAGPSAAGTARGENGLRSAPAALPGEAGTARDGPPPGFLYFLPILQALWVNLHVHFIFGPLLAACFALPHLLGAARRKRSLARPWAAILGLIGLACLANPHFLQGALYPLRAFLRLRDPEGGQGEISENQPLGWTFPLDAPGDPEAAATLLLLGLGPALFLLRRRMDARILAAFAVFLPLAAMSLRGRSLGAVLFPMLAARVLSEHPFGLAPGRGQKPGSPRRSAYARWALTLGLAALSLDICRGLAMNSMRAKTGDPRRFGLGFSRTELPWGAAAFLREAGLAGNMFNNFGIGSSLLWLSPGIRPFIDGEANGYPAEFFREYRAAMAEPRERFPALARRYAITHCVLMPGALDTARLIGALAADPDWSPVYLGEALVFAKRLPENRAAIERFRVDIPARLAELSLFYEKMGGKAGTRAMDASKAEGALSLSRLGLVALAFGQIGAAEAAYGRQLALEPEFSSGYQNLGALYGAMGRWDLAGRRLREALAKGASRENRSRMRPMLEAAEREEAKSWRAP